MNWNIKEIMELQNFRPKFSGMLLSSSRHGPSSQPALFSSLGFTEL